MQMDAYLEKEQIGTLFVLVGAPEGGYRGGGGGGARGFSPMCLSKNIFWRLLLDTSFSCFAFPEALDSQQDFHGAEELDERARGPPA